MTSNGLAKCYEAFERLKAGKPVVASHVDLPHTKITAGIVSFEAGLDRGYLKKSRPSHMPLIAQIEAFRKSFGSADASKAMQIKRANDKVDKARRELVIARQQLFHVLTQNVQLVERVRSLEAQVKQLSNVKELNPGPRRGKG